MTKKSRITRAADTILIAVFAAILWLPVAARIFRWENEDGAQENRVLAQCPAKFDEFYNDHFAFRSTLIGWHNLLKVEGLGASTTEKVVLGKAGWLFYNGDGQVDDYQGRAPLTPQQLARWKNVLEGKQAWLARQGIA